MATADTMLTPESTTELTEMVRSAPRVIAVGAGTKPRLSRVAGDVVRISTARLSAIIEYEPSEFTFTALAGTPVKEVVAALGERGQYLPFDPMLAEAGATLGGTIAAGLSGPGRWRFGGLRDFILGVRFVDGAGRLLRLGGKVVKNAAGFDVPKFFVGSAGRFGVLAEVTFKVFPRPAVLRTLQLVADDAGAQQRILTSAGNTRWELDALEAPLGEPVVYARVGGPAAAIEPLAAEILTRFPGTALTNDDAGELWRSVAGFGWARAGDALAKVVLTPGQVTGFSAWVQTQKGARGWIGSGGNVGYVSQAAAGALADSPWSGVALRGAGPLWLGPRRNFAVMQAVKAALDPDNRFPSLED
jgi:glycolate oxidase FAD binding subunit